MKKLNFLISSGVKEVQEFRQYFKPLQTDEKGIFRTIV
jgi:hypothetical protein